METTGLNIRATETIGAQGKGLRWLENDWLKTFAGHFIRYTLTSTFLLPNQQEIKDQMFFPFFFLFQLYFRFLSDRSLFILVRLPSTKHSLLLNAMLHAIELEVLQQTNK